jgi:hypothetical protein
MPTLRIPLRDLVLKAVIICDDFAFAAKANATLRRVGYQSGLEAQWIIKCWPINALNDTLLAEQALAETLDAHLIVFPARCARSLQSRVLDWLEAWASRRQIPAVALGFINDAYATDATTTVCPQLSRFIHKHDLNFIIDEGRGVEKAVRIPIGFSSARAVRNSFRAYGINE